MATQRKGKAPKVAPAAVPAAKKNTLEDKKPAKVRWAAEGAKTASRNDIIAPLKAFAIIFLSACYSPVSQLTLAPVYGAIPSSLYHSIMVPLVFTLAWVTSYTLNNYIPRKLRSLLPLLSFYIPLIQTRLFPHSYHYGATYGPLITESLTYYPLLFLSTCTVAQLLFTIRDLGGLFSGQDPILVNFALGAGSYSLFRSVARIAVSLLGSHRLPLDSVFLSRSGLQYVLSFLYAILAPSKLLFLTIPSLFHAALYNVHLPLPRTTALLNSTLQEIAQYQILARQDSVTGYLSVLENKNDRFRVLRCDHSLLGGEWLIPPEKGVVQKVREPVYAVFVMLEAVRLVEVDGRSKTETDESVLEKVDTQENALVIGLGVGTSVAALIAHNVNTTVLEIDPLVHAYAMTYFHLPANHTAVLEDAIPFVAAAAKAEDKKYDYIVHDVFTGGAEPASLFTVEFITNLRNLLKPEGVIAINYGGDLLSPSAALIVRTITSVFPTCRIYRELPAPSAAELAEKKLDFTNLVIFCTRADTSFGFRNAAEEDFLGTEARRQYLMPLHEVPLSTFGKEGEPRVLKDGDVKAMRMLEGWHKDSAVGHWGIMRGVVPDRVWENW